VKGEERGGCFWGSPTDWGGLGLSWLCSLVFVPDVGGGGGDLGALSDLKFGVFWGWEMRDYPKVGLFSWVLGFLSGAGRP